jgi:hypothetical protein
LIVPAAAHGDPFALFELAAATVTGLWSVRLLANLRRGRQMARAFAPISRWETVDGVEVRVLEGGGMVALVVGALRPVIYVGDELISELSSEELQAVLLHERHHAAIRAPLRAAAIEGWIGLVGRIGALRRALEDRLVDLERMADRHALAQGSSPAALARALLKTDRTSIGVAAASRGTSRRVAALLDVEAAMTDFQPAYEWLPLAVAVVAAAACHLLGLPLD